MARCEHCGKPITTKEFDDNDGLCTPCTNTIIATKK